MVFFLVLNAVAIICMYDICMYTLGANCYRQTSVHAISSKLGQITAAVGAAPKTEKTPNESSTCVCFTPRLLVVQTCVYFTRVLLS